ncbi:MAG: glycosyltransferase AglJ [Candidatus Micrarchaeota archaeon]|nr:MAG: glycosyltransferase AglJ [Candidatus Micrarchaeota archaeon]
MPEKELVSIVIPTWNEAGNIRTLIEDINRCLKGYNYEILVIDKYSEDGTADIARKMGARVILDKGGKGAALIRGFKEAKGDIVVSMDADLSHRPKELVLLIESIKIGYDAAMGSRFIIGGGSSDMPWYRRFGNKVFVILVNLLYRTHYTDLCYGYRSFSKEALNRLKLREEGFGIETEINIKCAKQRLNIIEIPSYEKKRSSGEAKLRTFRDGFRILKAIIKYKFMD